MNLPPDHVYTGPRTRVVRVLDFLHCLFFCPLTVFDPNQYIIPYPTKPSGLLTRWFTQSFSKDPSHYRFFLNFPLTFTPFSLLFITRSVSFVKHVYEVLLVS